VAAKRQKPFAIKLFPRLAMIPVLAAFGLAAGKYLPSHQYPTN
jgi:hypothetical protein